MIPRILNASQTWADEWKKKRKREREREE